MDDGGAPVLALDGPSGSGKGTVGQRLAHKLGWHYLDSGALYRAVALAVSRARVRLDDPAGIEKIASTLHVECIPGADDTAEIRIDGAPAGDELRGEDCGRLASRLAADKRVRGALLGMQRAARRPPGLVADGRDMGTVVFPGALLKIFLTAHADERARRRYNQLKQKGFDVNLAHLFQAIQERDAQDSGRTASPLKPADDAITLDTSDLNVEQVVTRILELLQPRLELLRDKQSGD